MEVAFLREILEVHVVGVHAMIQTFLPVLQSGNKKTVINLSSASGSLSTCHAEVSKRRTFQLCAIAVATDFV